MCPSSDKLAFSPLEAARTNVRGAKSEHIRVRALPLSTDLREHKQVQWLKPLSKLILGTAAASTGTRKRHDSEDQSISGLTQKTLPWACNPKR
ncbi:hypothetical protein Lal_00002003 [Lupinus albus]|nr:hypothetical protein Lal_00002003 [Lupinus albus]